MNILSLNSIGVSRFDNNKYSKNVLPNSNFGLKMSQPLSADTVSFKSTPKRLLDRTGGIRKNVANDINKIAQERQYKVDNYLNSLFGSLLVTKYTPENIIYKISGRAKSSESILEKAATRNWITKAEIFKNMTDLNGGKLVLRDGSRKGVNIILNLLANSIKEGNIDLIEIENKRPIASKKLKGYKVSQYDYADQDKLKELQDLTDEIHPSEKVKYIPVDYTESNYTALHFLLSLPGEDWVFEFQLMGYDVDLYKQLDDLIYKILNNKNVDKKFKKLQNIISPLNEPGNAKLKEQFNKYRSHVFLFQREKAPHIRKNEKYIEYFLPISDEIDDGEMREILDMNNLYQVYKACCIGKTEKIAKK